MDLKFPLWCPILDYCCACVSKFPIFCFSNLNKEKSGNASTPASHDNGGKAPTSHTYREEWQCAHCYFTWQDWQCVLSSSLLLCHTKWMHCHSSHARQEWTHCHCSLQLFSQQNWFDFMRNWKFLGRTTKNGENRHNNNHQLGQRCPHILK